MDNFNAGHVCGDQMDIVNGVPTGSVRISFGYMSTYEDVERFLQFLRESFLSVEEYYLTDAPSWKNELIESPENNLDTDVHKDHNKVINFTSLVQKSSRLDTTADADANISVDPSELDKDSDQNCCHASLDTKISNHAENHNQTQRSCHLKEICIYPVKSCAVFKV